MCEFRQWQWPVGKIWNIFRSTKHRLRQCVDKIISWPVGPCHGTWNLLRLLTLPGKWAALLWMWSSNKHPVSEFCVSICLYLYPSLYHLVTSTHPDTHRAPDLVQRALAEAPLCAEFWARLWCFSKKDVLVRVISLVLSWGAKHTNFHI